MADSSSKASPNHEPEKPDGSQVFEYVVGAQSGPVDSGPNPYSPLAAG